MKEFQAWLKVADNKAAALPTVWSFRNMIYTYGFDSRTLACLGGTTGGLLGPTQEFMGLVTTNASQYLFGPPRFNQIEETLDYKVAAPHFTPTGDVFKGTYNLVISSKFARCVYQFSNAPISASISITSENGEKDVATTVVSERGGLMYLSASGFTFSSPTIQVKLTQEKPTPSPTPSPTPTPKPSASPTPTLDESQKPTLITAPKKIQITCIKGTNIKKIAIVKPICPKGYVKK